MSRSSEFDMGTQRPDPRLAQAQEFPQDGASIKARSQRWNKATIAKPGISAEDWELEKNRSQAD